MCTTKKGVSRVVGVGRAVVVGVIGIVVVPGGRQRDAVTAVVAVAVVGVRRGITVGVPVGMAVGGGRDHAHHGQERHRDDGQRHTRPRQVAAADQGGHERTAHGDGAERGRQGVGELGGFALLEARDGADADEAGDEPGGRWRSRW